MNSKEPIVRNETETRLFKLFHTLSNYDLKLIDAVLAFLKLDVESDEDYEIVRLYQTKVNTILSTRKE